ncbi:hypothetical protein GE115_10430 [Agromyces sp. CFH 90414]|uniref:Activator of Hsp90 ATPase homologue 1/2-like C-terminal domain-containing protein n=1 Tax=Agromyces agglutinans TaxID=2662258 RepID=A0A6I2FC62_9MICO|nr:SRPBCC domain-containing protein [Agromyces agglutinans]MRG60280.1 hypothetical protein [Agromyces agglutinans]
MTTVAAAPAGETSPSPADGSFEVSTTLAAAPAAVFAAFEEPELRRRWFRQPGDRSRQTYRLDFRVGGGETATTVFAPLDREEHVEYASSFIDLVAGERLVLSYSVRLDGVLRWAALRTVALSPVDDGTATRVDWSEQYRFFARSENPAHDIAHLHGSTRLQLNALAGVLANG